MFQEIVKSVRFSDSKEEFIDLKYFSKCGKDIEKETKKCDNIDFEKDIEFTVSILLSKCPENQTSSTQLQIKPQGLSDILTIDIDILCQCSCEKENDALFQENAESCSFAGNLTCGICECNNNRIGKSCECNSITQYNINDKNKCINEKGNDNETCSGRGECVCGTCSCDLDRNNQRFTGQYCQCSNFDCPIVQNKLCSNNGKCNCGKCTCNDSFYGDACECSTDTSPCENNGTICSLRGDCECGKCNCKKTDGHLYDGKYCEECKTCFEHVCPEIEKCLECSSEDFETYTCSECKITIIISNDLPYYDDESQCTHISNENGCTSSLYYNYVKNTDTEKPILYVTDYRNSINCPEKLNTGKLIIFNIIS